MKAIRSGIGSRLACALVALAAAATAAQAAPLAQDRLYASPGLESQRSLTVAVLPAVAVADHPEAERWVEERWVTFYAEAKTRWVPADVVRARLAQAIDEPDVAGAVDREVWRRGEVEPETAACLARVLGVDAVLSIRIDRWEIADGGRAMVGMSAALSGADGARLWSISGLAGHGRPPGSIEQNFNSDMTWIRNPDLEPPREDGRNLDRALYKLLARWAWSLPQGPLFGEQGAPPLLAGRHE
jgi:hypothetical protein